MTAGPLVGVVVAAYNAERHLGAALRSLSDQSHHRWVAVVVDDGSADATAAVAAAAGRDDARIRLRRQGNSGVGAARNAGLQALPHEAGYVCFLDSDDVLLPGALAILTATLEDRPDATAATGWADTIDQCGQPVDAGRHRATQSDRLAGRGLGTRILDPGEDTTFASLAVYGTIWPPATALARRNVVAGLGGFDETLPSQEDWDLFLRMSRVGPIAFVDKQVAWYRRHDANASRDLASNRYYANVVRRKAWASPDSTPAERRCVLAASLRLRAWEAANELRSAAADLRGRRRDRYGADVQALAFRLGQLAHLRPPVPSRTRLERLASRDAPR